MIDLAKTDIRLALLAEIEGVGSIRRIVYSGLAPIWLRENDDDQIALRDREKMAANLLWKLGALTYIGDGAIELTTDHVVLTDEGRDLLAGWDGSALEILSRPFSVRGSVADAIDGQPGQFISNGLLDLVLQDTSERVANAIVALLNAGKDPEVEATDA